MAGLISPSTQPRSSQVNLHLPQADLVGEYGTGRRYHVYLHPHHRTAPHSMHTISYVIQQPLTTVVDSQVPLAFSLYNFSIHSWLMQLFISPCHVPMCQCYVFFNSETGSVYSAINQSIPRITPHKICDILMAAVLFSIYHCIYSTCTIEGTCTIAGTNRNTVVFI